MATFEVSFILAFEVSFILALIILQFHVFKQVFQKIERFKNFFPTNRIKIKKLSLSNTGDEVEILEGKGDNEDFEEIIKSTNDYLIKNKGAAADFSILKDISERHLEKFDNEIGNLINSTLTD